MKQNKINNKILEPLTDSEFRIKDGILFLVRSLRESSKLNDNQFHDEISNILIKLDGIDNQLQKLIGGLLQPHDLPH